MEKLEKELEDLERLENEFKESYQNDLRILITDLEKYINNQNN